MATDAVSPTRTAAAHAFFIARGLIDGWQHASPEVCEQQLIDRVQEVLREIAEHMAPCGGDITRHHREAAEQTVDGIAARDGWLGLVRHWRRIMQEKLGRIAAGQAVPESILTTLRQCERIMAQADLVLG